MDGLAAHATTVFMGFLAIMNPVANTPIFLGLTADDDAKTMRAVAFRSLMLAFVIIAVFSIVGNQIFHLFGLTMPALRVAGGMLITLMGFHMLQGEPSSIHHPSDSDTAGAREAQLSIAVSPLAMPILAGPGTIATAMSFTVGVGMAEVGITILAFAILCGITYCFFVFGERLVTYIGASALGVITRLMGLILAVIGVQMVIDGLDGVKTLWQ